MAERRIEMNRILDAPIDKVWDAWTNPVSLKQWKSPEGMDVPEITVDHKVGGIYKLTMEGNGNADPNYNGRNTLNGMYLEIEKPHKLVFSWLWEGAPAETHTTTVSVLLKELDPFRTELSLIHSGFPDDQMVKEHSLGWESTLIKLDTFLAQ